MEITWIQDFLALARSGNFSLAAENRHSTQSTLSRHIRALEHWVGAPLFDRARCPVQLTCTGQAFISTAEATLAQLLEFRSKIRSCDAHPMIVTFLVPHSVCADLFPRVLEAVQSADLAVLPRAMPCALECIESGMCANEAEFALTYKHDRLPRPGTLEALPSIMIARDCLVPVCAPGYEGRAGYAVADAPGKELRLLSFGPTCYLGNVVENELRRRLRGSVLRAIENPLMSSLRALAKGGFGVAWLPYSMIGADLSSGALVRAATSEWDIPLQIEAIRQHRLNTWSEGVWQSLSRIGDANINASEHYLRAHVMNISSNAAPHKLNA